MFYNTVNNIIILFDISEIDPILLARAHIYWQVLNEWYCLISIVVCIISISAFC